MAFSLRMILFIFITSCSTHRVINLSSCGNTGVKFFFVDESTRENKIVRESFIIGDGIDHPVELRQILSRHNKVCDDFKKISIDTKYNWNDVLVSFIPFISRKTITFNYVMDDE